MLSGCGGGLLGGVLGWWVDPGGVGQVEDLRVEAGVLNRCGCRGPGCGQDAVRRWSALASARP